jgi:hypothetical protein
MEYDFPVALEPIFSVGNEIPNKKAVIRCDTKMPLGIVSSQYQLLKHSDVIESFRSALSDQEHTEKIQLAKNGAQMFTTYKLSAVQYEVQKGDMVALQFVVKNSYDGTNALQIMLGAFRLVCTNGMVIGKQFFSYSQKHIGTGDGVVNGETIRTKVGSLVKQFEQVVPKLQEMSRYQMVQADDILFSPDLFDNNWEGMKLPAYIVREAQLVYRQDNDHTLWGYYNAFTKVITHNDKKMSPQTVINYGKVVWDIALNTLTK